MSIVCPAIILTLKIYSTMLVSDTGINLGDNGCIIYQTPLRSHEHLLNQLEPVADLQGGMRGHRPTLLLYFCQLHANFICIFALMQEFLYQFCIAYLY